MSEGLYLFLIIEEGGIGAPSPDEHVCVDWDAIEIHGHGTGGMIGMGPDFIWVET